MQGKEWWIRHFQEADELSAFHHLRDALITRKPFRWEPLSDLPNEERQPFRIIEWLLRRDDTRKRAFSFVLSCLEDAEQGEMKHGLTPVPILQSAFWCLHSAHQFDEEKLDKLSNRIQQYLVAVAEQDEELNPPMLIILQLGLQVLPLTLPRVDDQTTVLRFEAIQDGLEWLPAKGECATPLMKCWLELDVTPERTEAGLRHNIEVLKEVYDVAEVLRKTYTEDDPITLEYEHFGREDYLREHASDLLMLMRMLRHRYPDLFQNLTEALELDDWFETIHKYATGRYW